MKESIVLPLVMLNPTYVRRPQSTLRSAERPIARIPHGQPLQDRFSSGEWTYSNNHFVDLGGVGENAHPAISEKGSMGGGGKGGAFRVPHYPWKTKLVADTLITSFWLFVLFLAKEQGPYQFVRPWAVVDLMVCFAQWLSE